MDKKRIGIWGLGAVGTSALHFFQRRGNPIEVFDLKKPSNHALHILSATTRYTQQDGDESIKDFLERNDAILVSPGINITPYTRYAHKYISELDLVWQSTTVPIIGITGTVGKTTLTTLLFNYLQKQGYYIGIGGNIGTPMLDLISQPTIYDYLVLELSSFQLEYTRYCAPYLSIWTNFYPNHLDRHRGITNYFLAKCHIVAYQTACQHALLPMSIMPRLKRRFTNFSTLNSNFSFFSLQAPTAGQLLDLPEHAKFFYIEDSHIVLQKNSQIIPLIALDTIRLRIYRENLLMLTAALYCLNQPLNILAQSAKLTRFEHRLEYVATYDGITFYNDSKATIMQATLAAVQELSAHNIILLLGGLSKGVDRRNDIQKLSGTVGQVICFGQEAQQLRKACTVMHIPVQITKTLENAFELAVKIAKPRDYILLSPGGSSFDLFSNYKERGKRFKELIANYRNSKKHF